MYAVVSDREDDEIRTRNRMSSTAAVVVLVTWPEDADVREFARALVEARVAACVSALPPMDSWFRWDGAIDQGRERQLLIKTRMGRVDELRRTVRDLHPYDTPEFLVLPVSAGDERYLSWIAAAVEPAASPTPEP